MHLKFWCLVCEVENSFRRCVGNEDESGEGNLKREAMPSSVVFYNVSGEGANVAGAMCFIMYMMWYADFDSIYASFQSKGFDINSSTSELDLKLFVFTFGLFCREQHTANYLDQPEDAFVSVIMDDVYAMV
jgi:hypothetical protein